jgi:deazaflavin-dependent oxidoreductase (nitroreductase family)
MARTYRLGGLRRAANIAATRLASWGIGPPGLHLLTTTGRRSGNPRTTPVRTLNADASRYLVAPYGPVAWVHNIREHPRVQVRTGHTRHALAAREVDPNESGAVLCRYINDVKITLPYFDAKPSDPAPRFTAEADRHPVLELTEVAATGEDAGQTPTRVGATMRGRARTQQRRQ